MIPGRGAGEVERKQNRRRESQSGLHDSADHCYKPVIVPSPGPSGEPSEVHL